MAEWPWKRWRCSVHPDGTAGGAVGDDSPEYHAKHSSLCTGRTDAPGESVRRVRSHRGTPGGSDQPHPWSSSCGRVVASNRRPDRKPGLSSSLGSAWRRMPVVVPGAQELRRAGSILPPIVMILAGVQRGQHLTCFPFRPGRRQRLLFASSGSACALKSCFQALTDPTP